MLVMENLVNPVYVFLILMIAAQIPCVSVTAIFPLDRT